MPAFITELYFGKRSHRSVEHLRGLASWAQLSSPCACEYFHGHLHTILPSPSAQGFLDTLDLSSAEILLREVEIHGMC